MLPALMMLCACSEGVLDPKGPVGEQEKQLLIDALVPMLLVVIPVLALTLWFAWWFRASNARATYRPRWEYSGKIEFLIWIVPLLVILFVGTLAWSGAHQLDPYRPLTSNRKEIHVDVIAMDWRWLFVYPDEGVASVNELVIPQGTPVSFRLTSATVMNSFFIPSLGGQIYTMPGMQTRLSLLASEEGVYRGMAAQFSGDGFSDMHFRVKVTSDAAFSSWVQHARAVGATMDALSFDNLVATRGTSPVSYYTLLDNGVFDHAVSSTSQRHAGDSSMPRVAARIDSSSGSEH
ncbi:ubiquinol oxidase subunit II [Dyella soli]|uniref:Ubiquinol oxidase subunit 2 n=2 Tax=Dyella soli TaxID=522319 RepID=A0A4R0YQX2_9GAMM|nr:ubiquinol oxidase subunit II [Dyella soli]